MECAINCLIDYAKLWFHHHLLHSFYQDEKNRDNVYLKSLQTALPKHNSILVLSVYMSFAHTPIVQKKGKLNLSYHINSLAISYLLGITVS